VKKLLVFAAVTAAIVTALSVTPSHSQQVPGPPPLSAPWHEYYAQHPDEFQGLLSQFATRAPAPTSPSAFPASGTWTTLNNLPGVSLMNPLLLTDGTVMAVQSCTGIAWKLTPDINGSYINGTWTQIASLPAGYTPRFFGSAVLPDGRVIVEGGEYNTGCAAQFTNKGAIYDPLFNAWTSVAPPAGWARIGDAAGVVLPNGTYLQTDCCDQPPKAALLNAGTLTWTATGTGKFDVYDEEAVALLQNGNVLTVDAYVGTGTCGRGTEIYTPSTGAWTSAGNVPNQQSDCNSPALSFEVGPLATRPDGTAVTFSGVTTGTAGTAVWTNGTWSAGGNVPTIGATPYTLADAPAAVLPNGNILFAASPGNWTSATQTHFPNPTHFFEYDFATNTATQVNDTSWANFTNSFETNFLVLPTGQVLATDIDDTNRIQIYTPQGTYQAAWQPTIGNAPSCVVPGSSYLVSGTQLNGLTQGAYYGDDVNGWTNYPLVRIINNTTSHVFYARTSGHSTMSIAPNQAGSTNFLVAAGTELGASTLFVVANGIPSAGQPVTVSAANSCATAVNIANTHDFNGDGKSDILWRATDGTLAMWLMNGTQPLQTASLGQIGTNWTVVGQRDFNGDGKHDPLWRATDGSLAMWLMNGTQVLQSGSLGQVGTNWTVAGTCDLNGDGKGDIVWRASDGTVAIWLMNGTQVLQSASLGQVGTNWTIAGTGDVNGDGKCDLVWRATDGTLAIWLMNGTQVLQSGSLGQVGTNWTVVGTGDVNGDGKYDLVWRATDGTLAIWLLNGIAVLQSGSLGQVGTNWAVQTTGDYNGDTKSDLLWRATDGTLAMWLMNGIQVLQSASLGQIGTNWVVQTQNAD
jgi:hypothetical protein